ncbi:MAG: hypothetical protein COV45_09390 [Deltaproteobacteria bacterium CG11_big_fil_rev_8_21_14_0_20_47_16]|nr:MAG: hypothetical protein COV45_09390 [Deltaproteobacteria bacterium CG11_big_fil_rev_8_21_14_0_20_47_16]
MIPEIGSAMITLVIPASIFSLVAGLLGGRMANAAWQTTRLIMMMLVGASILLILAFIANDYSIAYVAHYSNRSLPFFYKITGLWAGLDGSLLFWVTILSVLGFVMMHRLQKQAPELVAVANASVMGVIFFFALMLLFPANPFTRLVTTPADGTGLNPLLQNEYMVIHPPSLYMGYVSAAIPFAIAMAMMWRRKATDIDSQILRPWLYLCWTFLTLGNLLGMHWAYVELGWGGFWAWDPVENAAVMPWFVLTGLLHSMIVQERRGQFRMWNMVLVVLAFMLTLFGTYLTRSGIVQSVHAFSNSTLGPYFISLMIVTALVGFGSIVAHRKSLQPRALFESVVSKEGAYLLCTILMVAATVAIIWGTMMPTITEAISGDRVTVGPPYFNRMMAPIGLFVLLLMGVGPVAKWTHDELLPLLKRIWLPTFVAGCVALIAWYKGLLNPYMYSAAIMVAFAFTTTVHKLFTGKRRNPRREGAYIVHLGFVIMFLGFAGAAYQGERSVELHAGETASFRGYEFEMKGINYWRDRHKETIEAVVNVTYAGKEIDELRPSHFLYVGSEQPTSEVDIHRRFGEDVYLIMGGFDYDKKSAEFKIMINPLVNLIWLGGAIMGLGIGWMWWPRRKYA